MTKPNLKNEKFYLRLVRDGKLKITKSGRAYNLVTGKELGKRADAKGNVYRKLSWLNPKTRKIVQVQLHRLVWAVYRGVQEDPTLVINHIDCFKQNCRLSNLELVTSTRNNEHAKENDLIPSCAAELNSLAVFSNGQVRGLRRRYAQGLRTVKQIAKKYKCSKWTVRAMLNGKTYSSVESRYTKECKRMMLGR